MDILEERLSLVEETIMKILYIQQENEIAINKFGKEVEIFKDNVEKMIIEMKQNTENLKQEMKEFKDEMRQFKENTEKIIAEMKQDTEILKQEMKQFKYEMKEEHRKMNKQWGELANKMGTIVEDIIFPATKPVLEKYFNCELTDLGMNIKRKRGNLKDEFDVIAVSEPCKTVYLIEVKATPKVEYINEFKDKKINRFRNLYPEYNDYKLVPILGSLRIEDDILNYLTKNGIYGMAYRELDCMDILSFEDINKAN
ncbi:hypothetical protein [Sulfurihydrogenibium sp.]|uniref:hypothetical protein n=1 Tax=Sulfurihydrogenibium sp. TaxID=2053621 RepID=UPI0026031C79|nr:hypothetical protein [Sulfurihydrogenibium sp.]